MGPLKSFQNKIKMSSDKEKPASHFHGPRNEEFHKLGMFERVFGDFENTASPYSRFAKNVLGGLFVAPVVWFHENVVEKFRGEEYPTTIAVTDVFQPSTNVIFMTMPANMKLKNNW